MITSFINIVRDKIIGRKQSGTFALQVFRQAVAGVITTSVDLFVFHYMLRLGLSVFASAAVSLIFAFLTSFPLTRWYVFGNACERKISIYLQLSIFAFITAVSLGINELMLFILTVLIEISPIIAKISTILICFAWTVFANRKLFLHKQEAQLI